MTGRSCIDDIASRKTPDGYYVIPAKRGSMELLKELRGVRLVEAGERILIMVRSRSMARKIAYRLVSLGLLDC